jgi:membrane peptidoglycan carboxypeptidase
VFHPAQQHRVVTPMTAAQMKKMMEGVVLFGTARRAILNGYTSAGKTGTAQKVDPATGAYSKTKYVASFIGFSPVNSPAVTIAVILDSPIYRQRKHGEWMRAERHQQFEKVYGFRSDNIPSIEFFDDLMLQELAADLGIRWEIHRPWLGLAWHLRPWKAQLRGARPPSRFWILVARFQL